MKRDPLTLEDLRRMALDIELRMQGFDYFRVEVRVPCEEGRFAGVSFEANGEKYRRIRALGDVHIVLPQLPTTTMRAAGFDQTLYDLFPDYPIHHWHLEQYREHRGPREPLIEVRGIVDWGDSDNA